MDFGQAFRRVRVAPLAFVSFLSADNFIDSNPTEVDVHTAGSLEQNLSSLSALLSCNFITFLKHVSETPDFTALVKSYLAFRSKPYLVQDRISNEDSPLHELDLKVFAVFHRLVCTANEHHNLPQEIRALSQESISLLKTDDSKPRGIDLGALDSAYAKFASSLEVFSFSYVLSLVAIAAPSNSVLVASFLQSYVTRRLSLQEEVAVAVSTCVAATKEGLDTLTAFVGSPARDSGKPKKGKATTNEDVVTVAHFLVDAAFSLYSLVTCAPLGVLQAMRLCSAQGTIVPAPAGTALLQALQGLYAVLPLLDRCAVQSSDPALPMGRCRTLLQALTLGTLSAWFHMSATAVSSGSEGFGDGMAWLEALGSPVVTALASDLMRSAETATRERLANATDVKVVLDALIGFDDAETRGYYISSLQVTDTFLPQSKPAPAPVPAPAPQAPQEVDVQDKISVVKAVLPDLGSGFLEACFHYFRTPEDVVEAVLAENLPPHLQRIDRKLERVAIGKHSLRQDASALLVDQTLKDGTKDSGVEYKAYLNQRNAQNRAFKDQQKALVKRMEAESQRDSAVVKKIADEDGEEHEVDCRRDAAMEYDDDYDDQYDDVIAQKPQYNDDWMSRVDETKRYNQLLREEEKEAAFWKGMQNTNQKGQREAWKQELDQQDEQAPAPPAGRHVLTIPQPPRPPQAKAAHGSAAQSQRNEDNSKTHHAKGDGKEHAKGQRKGQGQGEGKAKGQSQSKEQSQSTDKAAARAGQPTGAEGEAAEAHRKPRTKTFDRHHQKDRALRKGAALGGF